MTLAQITHAIVTVEVVHWDSPLPRRTDQAYLGIEGNKHRGGIRRRHGPALCASWRDPTGIAVLFQTKANGFTPPICLIVVVTACIHTEVATQRAHIAQLWSGDEARCRSESRIAGDNLALLTDLRQRHASPKAQAVLRIARP